VQNPLDLAALLLKNQPPWDRAAIDDVIAGRQTQRAILDERLAVFILYLTAVPGLDGDIRFLEDIYERDGELLTALNAPVEYVPIENR
jgi:murein L,D-transpeptidase YcbB/YkuD